MVGLRVPLLCNKLHFLFYLPLALVLYSTTVGGGGASIGTDSDIWCLLSYEAPWVCYDTRAVALDLCGRGSRGCLLGQMGRARRRLGFSFITPSLVNQQRNGILCACMRPSAGCITFAGVAR